MIVSSCFELVNWQLGMHVLIISMCFFITFVLHVSVTGTQVCHNKKDKATVTNNFY